jgi:opacity protein-like surface antigen
MSKKHLVTTALCLAAFTLAPAASADETTQKDSWAFMGGVKGGAIFSFGGLSPFVTAGVELGVIGPWLHRSFALAVNLDYTVPKKTGEETDPRVAPNGKYTWHLTQQELNLMPVFMYRATMLGRVVPYVGIGPRFYFLKSTVRSGEGTPSFKETTEQSTKVGFGAPLGVEITLGPGGIIGEMLFQYGPLDHTATGPSNTGAFSIAAGYRLILP